MKVTPIRLKGCPKAATSDLDKAVPSQDTVDNVKRALKASGLDILASSRRIDAGRLGIPVYLSICGTDAKAVMPTRKQMGKGSSPAQAEASAIMELMERYSFFSFWHDPSHMERLNWREAKKRFGDALLPVSEMLKSVQDNLEPDIAENLLDLATWSFYPATDLKTGQIVWLPLDWFRMLGEFNGSSAGNTAEESLLQGVSELVERHVCCLADRDRPTLPTIDPASCSDPVLKELLRKFSACGINILLKDISLGMSLPTVGALAWDPATFPESSEIVFTAGTASSPAKAAIRALTEVAQLGGDFCTNACYEASGLPKFTSLDQCQWLEAGPVIPLDALPDCSNDDILIELETALHKLPANVYGVDLTRPETGIPAHYCIAPGLQFRERDKNQSLGLFIGRKLIEGSRPDEARAGLELIKKAYPDAHFPLFFEAMLLLREGANEQAALMFMEAANIQPDQQSNALAAFYAGHAWAQAGEWQRAIPPLKEAIKDSAEMKEAHNLLGVALFKTGNYAGAEASFDAALKLDKGSAMDLANRGMARKAQGKLKEAAQDLRLALELDPGLEFARDNLEDLAT